MQKSKQVESNLVQINSISVDKNSKFDDKNSLKSGTTNAKYCNANSFGHKISKVGHDNSKFGQDNSKFGQDNSKFGHVNSKFGHYKSKFDNQAIRKEEYKMAKKFNSTNGANSTEFSSGESIFVLNYRGDKINWLPGKILDKLGNSPNYRIWVPSIGIRVHRNAKQIRHQNSFKMEDLVISKVNSIRNIQHEAKSKTATITDQISSEFVAMPL
jgi:hypothetical protein